MPDKTLPFYFDDNGVPKTGLAPQINIVEFDGTLHTNSQTVAEVNATFAPGAYRYTANLEDGKNYFMYVDGGATLEDTDRYIMETWQDGNIDRSFYTMWNHAEITEDTAIQSTMKVYDDDDNLAGTRIINKTGLDEDSQRYT